MKQCSCCREEKSLSEFQKNRSKKDGLQDQCKLCRADSGRQSYLSNRTEILENQQTPAGKELHKKACEKHIQDYPERHKARTAVGHAVRDEKLTRPSHCEDCGEEKFVQGHHEDYLKQLEVNWLCINCHVELHRKLLLV